MLEKASSLISLKSVLNPPGIFHLGVALAFGLMIGILNIFPDVSTSSLDIATAKGLAWAVSVGLGSWLGIRILYAIDLVYLKVLEAIDEALHNSANVIDSPIVVKAEDVPKRRNTFQWITLVCIFGYHIGIGGSMTFGLILSCYAVGGFDINTVSAAYFACLALAIFCLLQVILATFYLMWQTIVIVQLLQQRNKPIEPNNFMRVTGTILALLKNISILTSPTSVENKFTQIIKAW